MEVIRKERSDGKTELRLQATKPGEASPPVRSLLVDTSSDRLSGDRTAVAACLAFGRYFRGVVQLRHGVSARLASEIAGFKEPVWVAAMPVEDRATQFGGAGTTIVLDLDHRGWRGRNAVGSGQVVVLDVLRSDRWSGRLFAMDRLTVASNAWLLDGEDPSSRGLGSVVAVALLAAGDLDASRIVVPHNRASSSEWEARVTQLMAAIGVGLEFCEMDAVEHLVRTEGWSEHAW